MATTAEFLRDFGVETQANGHQSQEALAGRGQGGVDRCGKPEAWREGERGCCAVWASGEPFVRMARSTALF